MAMSDKLKGITQEEWRQLGYYYERDDANKKWVIVASPFGIKLFVNQLLAYANNEKNRSKSQHEHWGPYSYLKIMTLDEPGIDEHSIHGSLLDLKKLANIIKENLHDDLINKSLKIKDEYSKNCRYALEIMIKDYGFDPSSQDKQL